MIDDEFYKNLKPVKKHYEHYVWCPGKDGEAKEDPNVKAAYEKAGRKIEPLGVHGTYVAVDWDDCIGKAACRWVCNTRKNIKRKCITCEKDSCFLEGECILVCPTRVFDWVKPVNDSQDEGTDYTEKADPVREDDCIFCMVCVTECPTQAIKVDEALIEVHNNLRNSTKLDR